MASTEAKHIPSWLETSVVTLLLGIHFLIALYSITEKSLTTDESLHITAGAAYWTQNGFHLHPENGNLPQRLASLPLVLSNEPPLDSSSELWKKALTWPLADRYLFQQLQEPIWHIFLGRTLILFLSIACGLLLYCWAKQLWGVLGGGLALVLYCFSPNLIAHGRLMTSDMALTLTLFASVFIYWKLLHKITVIRLLAAGLLLGLTSVSKFSVVFLIPIVGCCFLIRICSREDLDITFASKRITLTSRVHRFLSLLAALLVSILVAISVIWTFYNFRADARNPEEAQFLTPWEDLLQTSDTIVTATQFIRKTGILPEDYLYGFAFTYERSKGRTAFFLGDYGLEGWTTFFPMSFLLKTPIPTFLCLLLVLWHALHILYQRIKTNNKHIIFKTFYRLTPIIIALVIIWVFAITSKLNIGHRHLLPTLPFTFLLASGAVAFLKHNRLTQILGITIATFYTLECIFTFPNYIAYFNQTIGSSKNGYLYFVDSSLDWGQELPQLENWLSENNTQDLPVYLAYFGKASPEYYGIESRYLYSYGLSTRKRKLEKWESGYYCISATMLQGTYLDVPKPLTPKLLFEYKQINAQARKIIDAMYEQGLTPDSPDLPQNWKIALSIFQLYRFDLLRQYLLFRTPVARIGNSLFVYKLKEADIHAIIPEAELGWSD